METPFQLEYIAERRPVAVEGESLPDTIEAQAEDQDLVILGPAAPSSPMDTLFTSTGEKIAERVPSSVLLTRAR